MVKVTVIGISKQFLYKGIIKYSLFTEELSVNYNEKYLKLLKILIETSTSELIKIL